MGDPNLCMVNKYYVEYEYLSSQVPDVRQRAAALREVVPDGPLRQHGGVLHLPAEQAAASKDIQEEGHQGRREYVEKQGAQHA